MKKHECIKHPVPSIVPVYEYVIASEDNKDELADWVSGPHKGKALFNEKFEEWEIKYLSVTETIKFGKYYIRPINYDLGGCQVLSKEQFDDIYELRNKHEAS